MAEAPSDSAGTGNVTPPDRVLTVPNALSVIRLVLVPVFLYLLLVSGALGWAVAILMFSGFSDWADGKIARLFDNQSSRLGELLDPAVDRIYMVVVPVAMAFAGFTAAQADGLRRAMTRKRSAEALESFRTIFVEHAIAHARIAADIGEKPVQIVVEILTRAGAHARHAAIGGRKFSAACAPLRRQRRPGG